MSERAGVRPTVYQGDSSSSPLKAMGVPEFEPFSALLMPAQARTACGEPAESENRQNEEGEQ